MIIECPSCSARYLLKTDAIGEEGRVVRCHKCGHQWHQEPDEGAEVDLSALSAALEDDHDYDNDIRVPDIDDTIEQESSLINTEENEEIELPDMQESAENETAIPDAVKPIDEEDEDPLIRRKKYLTHDDVRETSLLAKATAYISVLAIFVSIAVYLVTSKDKLMDQWPPMIGLYQLIEGNMPLQGEGLIIQKAVANIVERQGQDVLILQGKLINFKKETVQVPNIVATIKSSDEAASDLEWRIPLKVEELLADETYDFSVEYDAPSNIKLDDLRSINISFDLVL
ncbi:MAG: zinc-ribbon domain-containing protein [Pseudomonadota bacterium]